MPRDIPKNKFWFIFRPKYSGPRNVLKNQYERVDRHNGRDTRRTEPIALAEKDFVITTKVLNGNWCVTKCAISELIRICVPRRSWREVLCWNINVKYNDFDVVKFAWYL